ncbi:RDD family protein [Luteolibacter soli]|uniref:RDD family protein n=1 Tax=Luteolibacter soli TaxID=3135280 RepID=A0ABU9AR36_9BACT
MENEPDKSPSSGPPPPDIPPPPPSMPPPPDIPPPSSIPTTSEMPPPPPVDPYTPPAKPVMDGDDGEDEVPGSDAPFEKRALAGVIDCFVSGGLSWIVASLIPKLGPIVGIAYMLTRDALPFMEGHSLGKRILKIKAVTLNGKSLSGDWATSILRNLLFAIPFVGLIEVVVLFVRKDKAPPLRRLGDEWAKTKVVFAKEPSAI